MAESQLPFDPYANPGAPKAGAPDGRWWLDPDPDGADAISSTTGPTTHSAATPAATTPAPAQPTPPPYLPGASGSRVSTRVAITAGALVVVGGLVAAGTNLFSGPPLVPTFGGTKTRAPQTPGEPTAPSTGSATGTDPATAVPDDPTTAAPTTQTQRYLVKAYRGTDVLKLGSVGKFEVGVVVTRDLGRVAVANIGTKERPVWTQHPNLGGWDVDPNSPTGGIRPGGLSTIVDQNPGRWAAIGFGSIDDGTSMPTAVADLRLVERDGKLRGVNAPGDDVPDGIETTTSGSGFHWTTQSVPAAAAARTYAATVTLTPAEAAEFGLTDTGKTVSP